MERQALLKRGSGDWRRLLLAGCCLWEKILVQLVRQSRSMHSLHMCKGKVQLPTNAENFTHKTANARFLHTPAQNNCQNC